MMGEIDRTRAIAQILSQRRDQLIVTGLGEPCTDVGRLEDRPLNFYIGGAMGMAASVGLGLAIAQPDRAVVVVTGDAELMMNVGALATIAVQRPANLSIIVMDNEEFGETGRQRSHTGLGVDIAGIARACGIADAVTVRAEPELAGIAARTNAMTGPYLAVVKIRPGKAEGANFDKGVRSGEAVKATFRQALLGRP
jgi:thiamine pyrophosphate-dependent acetolactate synthase large subunit-like protein